MVDFLPLVAGLLGLQALARALATRRILAHASRHVPESRFRPDLEVATPDGAGSLVVLVHGTFCDGRTVAMWRDGLVSAGHRVWVFEYRYLESIPRNAARFNRAMCERLAGLGSTPPIVLVGYSQGGMILRWLLAKGVAGDWGSQVRGLVQVASPNLGCEPTDLAKLLWYSGAEDPAPALTQLQRQSRLLAALDGCPVPARIEYGVIYGHGRGREVLGRFWGGGPQGRPWTNALGVLYEALFLPPEEHDGLVSTTSAVALLAEPGRGDGASPVRVETDHLGLLVHSQVVTALVEFAESFLRGTGRSPSGGPS